MNAPIRVLLADDHPLVREGLRALLSELPGFEVAAEAASGTAAVEAAALTQPDVVVMDIKMPGLNGIEATRRIVEADDSVGVLIVTMLEDDESVFAAMRAGARGYLLKGAERDDIVRAIESVAEGEAVFGAPIARRITEYFATPAAARRAAPFPELTDREREILDLAAQGLNNRSIASRLYLSEKTVRNNISTIFNKLHVLDRAQAIVRARNAGLGREGDRS
jgi:DNA-binding NarL/FixJ family response regulator